MDTLIVGSGIIGLSTAYYLSRTQPGHTIHLVDSSPSLFASASGYAGGFVARDWFSGSLAPLGRLSFDEHRRLAGEHVGRETWGYARTVTVSHDVRTGQGDWLSTGGSRAATVETLDKNPASVPWLKAAPGDVTLMDDGEGTSIVDPLKLCHFLLDECNKAGVTLHHPATALAVATDMRGELASVRVGYTDSSTEVEIPVTRLLLAAGCWTPAVFRSLFPQASVNVPVTPLGGHSLVVRMPGWEDGAAQQDCHSVYCSIDELSPELYSRTNGVIYLAGVNSSAIPLPELATGSQSVEASIERLKDIARRMIATPEGEELQVVRTGLCFRPITPSGAPILDRIADEQLGPDVATRGGGSGGVFVAVGHGPWGISLSLGTGKVMAELMQGKEPSADISGLGL